MHHWRTWLLILFLCYGPWHGAAQLGERTPIGLTLPGLSQLTWTGLVNLFWTCVLIICFIGPLAKSLRRQPPRLLEYLLILTPACMVLNTKSWTTSAITSIQNAILLSFLLLSLIREKELTLLPRAFRKSFLIFPLISYLLALGLPFLIEIGDHQIWRYVALSKRYRGWVGEGTPYALVGQIFTFCGVLLFFQIPSTKHGWLLPAVLILSGATGIFLTVHRTSLLGLLVAIIAFTVCTLKGSKAKNRSLKYSLIALLIVGLPLSSPFFEKTMSGLRLTNTSENSESFQNIMGVQLPLYAALRGEPWVIAWMERFVTFNLDSATGGRINVAVLLFRDSGGLKWFGMGTGWATNHLKSIQFSVVEPQNDYLKMVVDQGMIGLFWTLLIMLLFYRISSQPGRKAFLVLFAINMLGENYFVFPSFGYGFALVAFLLLKSSESIQKTVL